MTTAVLEAPTTEADADDPVVVRHRTAADLIHDLGDISPARVRLVPPPGTATVADIVKNKGCELIDGTIVEKAMGWRESVFGFFLARLIDDFVRPRNLGMIGGEQGMLALQSDLVRMADIAFVSWDRVPDGKMPEEAAPLLAPDLAVEVLSRGNTPKEMARKRKEFFTAGTRLIWIVDPVARTVTVYTSETEVRTLTESDTLDGGTVLPGLAVALRDVFAELDRRK